MGLRQAGIFLLAAWLGTCQAHAETVRVVGSNTLEPFLQEWAWALSKTSALEVEIRSPGTSVAPRALAQDQADIAAMNREMTSHELEGFVRTHGYYPTAIAVAVEAVAIYAHPDNPLNGLEYSQLDALYSQNHGCGWKETISRWGQLGVAGPWKDQRIRLLGQDQKSPVQDFFRKSVICRDDFRADLEILSEEKMLEVIASDRNALGYARYQPGSRLKAIPIKRGDAWIPLTEPRVYDKQYRLQHFLYLYLNKPKGQPVAPAVQSFIRYGLSAQGQQLVREAGFLPLSDEWIQRQLAKLK